MSLDIHKFISAHITRREQSLLARDLEVNRSALAAAIEGRRVLVIGGAGTIGSSFVKAILAFRPAALYVVDYSENGLTELTRDLRSTHGQYVPEEYLTYPVDFGSGVFAKILERKGPFDIVANFAAHKHVRSEKDAFSIEAMVDNNVAKNYRLVQLLERQVPEHFFCVSTDKATNPVNVMGASKKMMEGVLLAAADALPVTTARFANVAFSNGSLLAGFLERLNKRQPLSSPKDVRRYFVSPEESGQLCLMACMRGRPGEIFFPKLGEEQMMRFSDIAVALLRALGMQPLFCASEEEARAAAARMPEHPREWPVFFFESDTSGEKMYEEFYGPDETVDMDRFHALGVVQGRRFLSRPQVEGAMEELDAMCTRNDLTKADWVAWLARYVPDFAHKETGKSLDAKM